MDSPYIPDQTFKYWWHNHFFGNFSIRWIFIADMPYDKIPFLNDIIVNRYKNEFCYQNKNDPNDSKYYLKNGGIIKYF